MNGRNLLKKYNALFYTAIILIGFISIFLIASNISNISYSQDEFVIKYSVTNYLESGEFHKEKLDTCLYQTDIETIGPEKLLYYNINPTTILFYSPFFIIFGENVFPYINLIFFILTLLVSLLLLKDLINYKSIRILGFSMVSFFTILMLWSSSSYNIIPALFFFITSIFFIISKNHKNNWIAGIFFSILLFIRFSDIIFLPAMLLFILIRKEKKINFLRFIIPILLSLIIIFFMNFLVFGNPLFLPQTHFNDCFNIAPIDGGLGGIDSILRFFYHGENQVQNLLLNFNTLIQIIIIFLPLSLLLILGFLNKKYKEYNLFLFIVFLTTFLFYGRRAAYYGFATISPFSSFTRYFLYFFILLILSFSLYIDNFSIRKNKYIKILAIITMLLLILLSAISFLQFETYGLEDFNSKKIDFANVQGDLISSLDKKGIILANFATNKYFYSSNHSTINYEKVFNNDKLSEEDYLLEIKSEINETNFPVYLILSEWHKNENDLKIIGFIELNYPNLKKSKIGGIEIYRIK
ncbi:hypothetical protein HN415_10225 [Candidatus Woesearchaeota archaeon]|jgi:hypothetical protein|nr:hypothetical protein [Candidatus Woesearchaeota archaeon]